MLKQDSSLEAYPRPSVAIDLVLTALLPPNDRHREQRLGVVVLPTTDNVWALPGRFVRERETIRQTFAAIVTEKLDYQPSSKSTLRMLDVFDDPDRDPRGWAMAVAYAAAIPEHHVNRVSPAAEVWPVRGPAPRGSRVTSLRLAYDHDEMVTMAVRRMRRRYERNPDPDGLLRAPYTLTQLRHAHEAVLGEPLKRDTFNRRMREYLEPALSRPGEELFTSETVGRPAQLFRPKRGREITEPFPLPRSGFRFGSDE